MRLKYVSEYITLSQEGLVSKLECPMDQGLLMCNLNNNDEIFLYCLSCNYINILGIESYNKIKTEIERLNKND